MRGLLNSSIVRGKQSMDDVGVSLACIVGSPLGVTPPLAQGVEAEDDDDPAQALATDGGNGRDNTFGAEVT